MMCHQRSWPPSASGGHDSEGSTGTPYPACNICWPVQVNLCCIVSQASLTGAAPATRWRRNYIDVIAYILGPFEEARLPRYYFHLINGEVLCDETGQDFAGLEAARAGAILGVSELIGEHLAENRLVDLAHRIEIADESGKIVDKIIFGELFTYQGTRLQLVDR